MDKVEIIDNFLPLDDFYHIKNIMMGEYFQWYYNDYVLSGNYKNFQFIHNFYNYGVIYRSPFLDLFKSTTEMLGVKKLQRIKANLNPRTLFKRKTGYHNDFANMTTAVFYINSNNGGTKFANGKFVRSKENRVIIFDSNLKHTGITFTDQKRRIVVNFNFIK